MAVRTTLLAWLLVTLMLAGCSDAGSDDGPGKDDDATPGPSVSVGASASASASTTASSSSASSSASTSSPTPRPAKTFDIDIEGNDFVDGSLTVQKGDTVRWTQRDVVQHTVTADDGSFDSGSLTVVSAPFAHTFDDVGSFPYHCAVHASMTDTITVVASLPS